MEPVERNEELSGGMFIFALSFSFPWKLAILFCLFSSMNLYLSLLSGLYPNPNLNRSFFWITAIGLSMPYSLFPKPFPTWAPLPGTCLMLEWVTFDSFGTKTFDSSPTYMAFTNFKDLKEHSIAFSSIFTYSVPAEVVAFMFSLTDTQTSCPSITNLIF